MTEAPSVRSSGSVAQYRDEEKCKGDAVPPGRRRVAEGGRKHGMSENNNKN